jgi:hypothetical protein
VTHRAKFNSRGKLAPLRRSEAKDRGRAVWPRAARLEKRGRVLALRFVMVGLRVELTGTKGAPFVQNIIRFGSKGEKPCCLKV